MFYNQPIAHRFGKALADDVESGQWSRVEMAVAWVRRSGTRHLEPSFQKFLRDGGVTQVTVGIDIENTSYEGLKDLLNWQSHGEIETYIYHNETDSTFHPKVYLLRNENAARVIVGSNNLTEAGLFVNTEAGLQIDAPMSDPLVADVRTALAAWRDASTGFARRLDTILLGDLLNLGYVFPERDLRQRREAIAPSSRQRRGPRESLFRGMRIARPPAPRVRRLPSANIPGTVLLMRVRRASEHARRTQIQLPFRVVQSQFFAGVNAMVSAHDARGHPLVHACARGGPNTIKTEVPEIEPMVDPVLRLERTPTTVIYQAFDGSSVLGQPIRQALLNGFAMIPPTTFKTVADPAKATWWRFI